MQIFLKAGKTLRLYSEDHRYFDQFTDEFSARLDEQLQLEESLVLEITPHALQWDGHVVFENLEQRENLAFKLYRDGVRILQFRRGVTASEIREFVTLVAREVDAAGARAQDLSVLFWEAEFKHIHLSVAQTFVQHTDETRQLYSELEHAAEDARAELIGEGAFDGLPDHEPLAWTQVAPEDLDGDLGEPDSRGSIDGVGLTELPDIPRESLDDRAMEGILSELHGVESAYASFEEVGTVLARVVAAERNPEALRSLLRHLDEALAPLLATAGIGPINSIVRRLSLLSREAAESGSVLAAPLSEFLRHLAQPERLAPLARALDQDWEDAWKGELFTLISLQDPESAPKMAEFLASLRREEPRHTVVDALILLNRRSAQAFVPLLRHPAWHVAADAAWAIAKIGDPVALDQVVLLASRPEAQVRLAALQALKGHQSPRVQEIMLQALTDAEPDVRLAALRWLAVYQVRDAVEPIARTLRERDFAARKFEERRGWVMTWGILAPKEAWPYFRRVADGARGGQAATDEVHLALLGLKATRLPEARQYLEEFARLAKGDLLILSRKALT